MRMAIVFLERELRWNLQKQEECRKEGAAGSGEMRVIYGSHLEALRAEAADLEQAIDCLKTTLEFGEDEQLPLRWPVEATA